jgi:cellulose synthase/poly-beta-1,6-N-acetylglucosamine synthase-like glycosyltransferase
MPNGKKRAKAYKLVYIPGAWATIIPPDSFGTLIVQRRRWINGSNMTLFYILN